MRGVLCRAVPCSVLTRPHVNEHQQHTAKPALAAASTHGHCPRPDMSAPCCAHSSTVPHTHSLTPTTHQRGGGCCAHARPPDANTMLCAYQDAVLLLLIFHSAVALLCGVLQLLLQVPVQGPQPTAVFRWVYCCSDRTSPIDRTQHRRDVNTDRT
jgi:hypothetical protein